MLLLSKFEYSDLSLKVIDLNVLILDIIQDFQTEISKRTIQWTISAIPNVIGDKVLLRLVFVNLISNALKFTKNCAKGEINIGYQMKEGEIILFVEDNGVGFDMNESSKLFTAFQRLDSGIAFEGTVIGLANVHRIINRHGGKFIFHYQKKVNFFYLDRILKQGNIVF